MRSRTRALLVVLAAATTMLVAVGNADSRRIEINSLIYRIVWPSVRFQTPELQEIICPITMTATFPNTIIFKVANTGIGQITAASIGSCTGSIYMSLLTETLPWTILYKGFAGVLPNIEQVLTDIIGFRFRWGLIFSCLYASTGTQPQTVGWAHQPNNVISTLNFFPLFLESETSGCQRMRVNGSGPPTIPNAPLVEPRLRLI